MLSQQTSKGYVKFSYNFGILSEFVIGSFKLLDNIDHQQLTNRSSEIPSALQAMDSQHHELMADLESAVATTYKVELTCLMPLLLGTSANSSSINILIQAAAEIGK